MNTETFAPPGAMQTPAPDNDAWAATQRVLGAGAAPQAQVVPFAKPERKPAQPKRGLYYERFSDVTPVTDSAFLIDDLLDAGALSCLYGDSNVGKSFLAMDMSFHIATGTDWNGCKVKQGAVIYVAAEGGIRNRNRFVALRNHFQIYDAPIALVPCPINLLKGSADVKGLIDLVRMVEDDFKLASSLVVIDTLARATQGGDENNGVDMGGFVGNIDAIRASLDTHPHLTMVHHCGKDKARGARGWSGIRAAIDTELEVADGIMTATKQRDLDTNGKIWAFELKGVKVGTRDDDKVITSCVVRWREAATMPAPSTPKAQGPGKAEMAARRMIQEAITELGREPTPSDHIPSRTQVVTKDEFREFAYRRGISETDTEEARKKAFQRCYKTLTDSGYIAVWDNSIWIAKKEDSGK